jgi:CubicO group peptidase (beta-lactamase class C family)
MIALTTVDKLCSYGACALTLLPMAALAADSPSSVDWQSLLNEQISVSREDAQVVGMGAIIIRNGEVLAISTDGERATGSGVDIAIDDKWHLGSISKSMTATALARLVESGQLRWDLRLDGVFPATDELHPEWRSVTFAQLLSHTSGAQRDLSMLATLHDPEEGKARTKERENQVLKILRKAPQSLPASQYAYSNVGYTIAGVVAEKVTGRSWEALMREELFQPLSITSGGFGAPSASKAGVDQPSGHDHILGRTTVANADDELSSLTGPAGSVHMSLRDLMTYADNHLQGARGHDGIITASSYQLLHTPVANNYAYGWNVSTEVSWSSSPVVWHAGSNGMWCAVLALFPESNAAVAVTTNDCNDRNNTFDAIWQVIERSVIALQESEIAR